MRGFKTIFLLLLTLLPCFSLLAQNEEKSERDYQKWKFGVSGGMSYMLGSTKDAKTSMMNMGIDSKMANNYYGDLVWGPMASVDAQYFFKPQLGAGVKYIFYSNSAQLDENVSLPMNGDGVSLFYGPVKEHFYVNYVGPAFCSREFFGMQKKWALTSLFSVGYVHYRNEVVLPDLAMLMTGSTVGLHGAIGVEYNLTRNIALGLDLSYMYAVLSNVTLTNGKSTKKDDLEDKKENLSRLDLGLNLKFYF